MKTQSLFLTLSLAFAASAAIAAIQHRHAEPAEEVTVPRIVVTASRAQVVDAEVPRIVVVARRTDAGMLLASK